MTHDFSPARASRASSCLTPCARRASASAPPRSSPRSSSRSSSSRAAGFLRVTSAACRVRERVALGLLLRALLADLDERGLLARALRVGVGLDLGLERREPLHHGAVVFGHTPGLWHDPRQCRCERSCVVLALICGARSMRRRRQAVRPRRADDGEGEAASARRRPTGEADAGETKWGRLALHRATATTASSSSGRSASRPRPRPARPPKCKAGQKCTASGGGPATVTCAK